MDAGDYRAAIAQLKEVVRLEPESFEAHLDLGICFAQKGFYAESERAYANARELKADDILLHYNAAALYALWAPPEPGARGARGRHGRRTDREGEGLAPVGSGCSTRSEGLPEYEALVGR